MELKSISVLVLLIGVTAAQWIRLPSLSDVVSGFLGDEAPDLPQLPDVPDLADLPEVISGVLGDQVPDLPDLPDLADLPDVVSGVLGDQLPQLPDVPDLADLPDVISEVFGSGDQALALPDVPDLADLPEVISEVFGSGDQALALPDVPDLADLPEVISGVLGDQIPDVPDLADLPDIISGALGDQVPELPDVPDLADLSDMLPELPELPQLPSLPELPSPDVIAGIIERLNELPSGVANDVCSPQSRETDVGLQACIEAIKLAMEDNMAFWFGYTYFIRCPLTENDLPQFNLDCPNFNPMGLNLADRLFPLGGFNATTITSYLDVVMHEKPGSYQACGHLYNPAIEANHTLDPINPTPLTPWQTSHGFTATVQGLEDTEALYTLIIVDAGFSFIHGVYIDIPGDNFDINLGQPLSVYSGPKHYKDDKENPYVFLLFRQDSFFDDFDQLSGTWIRALQTLQQALQATPFMEYTFPSLGNLPSLDNVDFSSLFALVDFAKDLKLYGPVAVNWVMVTTDAYAAQYHVDQGFVNMCPIYDEQAAREYDLVHVPEDAEFRVSVAMEFKSVAEEFSICCANYSYPEGTKYLDPIGDGFIEPFYFKDAPSVTLIKKKLFPQETDFIGEMYTLLKFELSYDPQYATPEKPFMDWMVTNIRFGNVDMGKTVIPYLAALPLYGVYRPQFMLYKQTGRRRIQVNPFLYTPLCTDIGYRERCLFELDRFVEENGLEFVGATWFTSTGDAYAAKTLRDLFGLPESEACFYAGIPAGCFSPVISPTSEATTKALMTTQPEDDKPRKDNGGTGSDKGRRRP